MRNQNNHISHLIQQINHRMNEPMKEQLENEGLTVSQARVLYYLYCTEGSIQSEIKDSLSIKSSSLTKLIDTLEKKKFVYRVANKDDSRVKQIYLTKKGREKEKRLWALREENETHLTQFLTQEQKEQFTKYLFAIQKTLE